MKVNVINIKSVNDTYIIYEDLLVFIIVLLMQQNKTFKDVTTFQYNETYDDEMFYVK